MSAQRQDPDAQDPEATVTMPRPTPQVGPGVQVDEALDDASGEDTSDEQWDEDPEKTIVRENWEAAVIRRVASHVAAVQSEAGEDCEDDYSCFGWESEGLRRLSRALQRQPESAGGAAGDTHLKS